MRQEQPKTARLRHSGPTKGGQKPKISSTLPPRRQFGYISAELWGHLGNVGYNLDPAILLEVARLTHETLAVLLEVGAAIQFLAWLKDRYAKTHAGSSGSHTAPDPV